MGGTLVWLGHASFRLDTPGGERIYGASPPESSFSRTAGRSTSPAIRAWTFPLLRGTPAELRELAPGVEIAELSPGEAYAL